jgi:hypothetical protein
LVILVCIMDAHPGLTTFVYVALVVFALLVIAYWVTYTRRLKTPPHVGKCEGIAMATDQRERAGNPRHAA